MQHCSEQFFFNTSVSSTVWPIFRSSRPELFCKKGVLRNLAKFTGKHLCQSLFFNKVAGLRPAILLKKGLWRKPPATAWTYQNFFWYVSNGSKFNFIQSIDCNITRIRVELIDASFVSFSTFWCIAMLFHHVPLYAENLFFLFLL